jgi:hypothetical protein
VLAVAPVAVPNCWMFPHGSDTVSVFDVFDSTLRCCGLFVPESSTTSAFAYWFVVHDFVVSTIVVDVPDVACPLSATISYFVAAAGSGDANALDTVSVFDVFDTIVRCCGDPAPCAMITAYFAHWFVVHDFVVSVSVVVVALLIVPLTFCAMSVHVVICTGTLKM